jgi:hypothetical protein
MAKGIKTGGRKPGSKDKPELKLFDIFAAYWLQDNGQAGFAKWANENLTEAYRLISRRLPTEIQGNLTIRKLVELDE